MPFVVDLNCIAEVRAITPRCSGLKRANSVIIVGQAFAGPMLAHLDANPGKYDLSSLLLISSSGVMWSQENKDGLLRHLPQAALFDSYGSSEAVGLGGSVSTNGHAEQTANFELGEHCAVFTEDGRRVERGNLEMIAHVKAGAWHHDAADQRRDRGFAVERMRSMDDQPGINGLLAGLFWIHCPYKPAQRHGRGAAPTGHDTSAG